MSNGPQDPLGTERWVIMSTKGTSSASSADKLATSERTRRAATKPRSKPRKGRGAAGYGNVKGTNTCTYATSIFFFFFSFSFFVHKFFLFFFSFLFVFFFSRLSIFISHFPIFPSISSFQLSISISDFHFNFPGVLALGLGENRTFCAIVSREFYWTSTAAMRGGAAAMAKPRDTLTVRLCFMDVSNCASIRPFPLGDLVGRVCKQLGSPVDDLLPASSRACVL